MSEVGPVSSDTELEAGAWKVCRCSFKSPSEFSTEPLQKNESGEASRSHSE